MGEDLGDVIRNGFDTYRHNLNISIPFLLYLLLIPVIIIPTAILLFTGEFEYKETIMPLWILVLLLVLSLGFIFLAGAAGMAREATLEKRTSLRTMWIEGKAHCLQVLFAAVGFFALLTIRHVRPFNSSIHYWRCHRICYHFPRFYPSDAHLSPLCHGVEVYSSHLHRRRKPRSY